MIEVAKLAICSESIASTFIAVSCHSTDSIQDADPTSAASSGFSMEVPLLDASSTTCILCCHVLSCC